TTEQALLTNHKTRQYIRRFPSEFTTLAVLFLIYCSSSILVYGWLQIFLVVHSNTQRQRIV
uniref:G_PROTEIN_RECEP_F1_2 domain-containing protein n=1 Tax=Mesocestoides corti TaxID=53468 RepID=A0A5K3EQF7_MESCO